MATTGTQPQDIESTVIAALASFGADPEVLTREATLERSTSTPSISWS